MRIKRSRTQAGSSLIQLLNEDYFQVVLQHACVVHGAALLMAAVLQNLLLKAAPKQPLSGFVPSGASPPKKIPANTSAFASASR